MFMFPHDPRICSRYLAGRLKKFAAYLVECYGERCWKCPEIIGNLSLDRYQNTGLRITAFTDKNHGNHCAICSERLNEQMGDDQNFIRVGGFGAWRCHRCRKRNFYLCPETMSNALDTCLRPMTRMVALVLMRCGLDRNLRRFLMRNYLWLKPFLCLHIQDQSTVHWRHHATGCHGL